MTTPLLTVRPGGGLVVSFPAGVMLLGPSSWSSARRIWSKLERGIDPHLAVEDATDVLIISTDRSRRFLYRRGEVAVDAVNGHEIVDVDWEAETDGWYSAFVPASAEVEATVDGPCYRGVLPLEQGMATAFSIRLTALETSSSTGGETPERANRTESTSTAAPAPSPAFETMSSMSATPSARPTEMATGAEPAKPEPSLGHHSPVAEPALPLPSGSPFAPQTQAAAQPEPPRPEPAPLAPSLPPRPEPAPAPLSSPPVAAPAPAEPDVEDRTLTQEQYQALMNEKPALKPTSPMAQPGSLPAAVDLVVSTGHRIALERSAVLGREPRSDVYGVGTNPHMVALPSPAGEISRVHCAFVRHGSGFAVVDLGAANGTSVLRMGVSHSLVPHTPLVLESGDIVDLGESITAWLEPRA